MGGHGGLNILPQKSWNVYGQRNRQKVAEDEAAAREKQGKEDAQLARGDREVRLAVLRSQGGASAQDVGNAEDEPEHHINFWAKEEAATKNPEVEAERKAEARKRGDPKTQTCDSRFDERFAVLHGHSKEAPWYAKQNPSLYTNDPASLNHDLPSHVLPPRKRPHKSDNTQAHRDAPAGAHPARHWDKHGVLQGAAPPDESLKSGRHVERPASDPRRIKSDQSQSPSPDPTAKHRATGRKHKKSRHRDRSTPPRKSSRHRASHSPSRSRGHKRSRRRQSPSGSDGSSSSGGQVGGGGKRSAVGSSGVAMKSVAELRKERLERESKEAQRTRELLRSHFR